MILQSMRDSELSNLSLHLKSSLIELPVVPHEYCGYCEKAITLPRLPNPSSRSLEYTSSVKGLAYRNATYGRCGAEEGDVVSRILQVSRACNSDHLRIGEPPPISAYCFWIFDVLKLVITLAKIFWNRPKGIMSPSDCC